jgi:CheY-like chemotaxis protein
MMVRQPVPLSAASMFAGTGAGWMAEAEARKASVLLVEDEVMIRMMVTDMLADLGHTVACEAGEIDEALRLAETAEFDLAILDVNVNGKTIVPVADAIERRNRPFVFSTGYSVDALPENYRDRPALQKPFRPETLQSAIETALRGGR